jgi:hypothetical protein
MAGNEVFVGGDFLSVGGLRCSGLAAIDIRTGRGIKWTPRVNRPVHAISIANDAVYVGGEFTQAGSTVRNSLAAFCNSPLINWIRDS